MLDILRKCFEKYVILLYETYYYNYLEETYTRNVMLYLITLYYIIYIYNYITVYKLTHNSTYMIYIYIYIYIYYTKHCNVYIIIIVYNPIGERVEFSNFNVSHN